MAVLRVKVLLQSEGFSVPIKCDAEELKRSTIPKRGIWERQGVGVVFVSEQLMRGEVGASKKRMGKATKGSLEYDPGGSHNQHSIGGLS